MKKRFSSYRPFPSIIRLLGQSSCPSHIKSSIPPWTGSATCVELKASRRALARVTSCTRQLPGKRIWFPLVFVQLVIDVQQNSGIVSHPPNNPHAHSHTYTPTAHLMSKGQFDCQEQEEHYLSSINFFELKNKLFTDFHGIQKHSVVIALILYFVLPLVFDLIFILSLQSCFVKLLVKSFLTIFHFRFSTSLYHML